MKMSVYIFHLLLSMSLLAYAFPASAQVTIEWDKTYGGSDDDELTSIASSPDGGYLLAGTSYSPASGDKSERFIGTSHDHLNKGASPDYWIVKVNSSGNKQWDKTIGGEGNDRLHSVATSPDGGYLLVGSFEDNSIMKIDEQGNKQWEKIISGGDFSKVIVTTDGGYLLAGVSYSSDGYSTTADYWIVKTDARGNKQWEKTFGGKGGQNGDLLTSVVPSPDGGYLLAGTSDSFASADKSEDRKGLSDFWIVKIDATGHQQWEKIIGGENIEKLTSVVPSPDGGYLLAGTYFSPSSADKSEWLFSGDWIVKIDNNGHQQWEKIIGGGVDEHSYKEVAGIVITPDGGYLLAGSSRSPDPASGNYDEPNLITYRSEFWLTKIEATGHQQWEKIIGGGGGDYGELLSSTMITPDGSYLLAGSSDSPASGDKSEGYRGVYDREWQDYWPGYDYWIVKVKEEEVHELPKVADFTLVNAETDEDIQELKDGDVINLAATGNVLLNVRVNTVPQTVDHIQMHISGPIVPHDQTERTLPYTLYGDDSQGDYHGKRLRPGQYILTATPYSQDQKGTPRTISFQVIHDLIVQSFTLVNAATNKDIKELKNGDIINLAETGSVLLNFRANTSPAQVDHIQMYISGPIVPHAQTERTMPYALYGDDTHGDYYGKILKAGMYTLTAIPYSKDQKGKTLTIAFQVVWQADNAAVAETAFQVYPVPTTAEVHIVHENQAEKVQLLLLDHKGNVVLSRLLPQQAEKVLDLSSYGKGSYYLKLITRDAVETRRIVVE